MSLLNDALKDIDRHNFATTQTAKFDSHELASKGASWRQFKSWILPSVALIAVIYWLLFGLNLSGTTAAEQTPIDVPKPLAVNSKWLELTDKEKNNEDVIIQSNVTTFSPDAINSAHTNAIQQTVFEEKVPVNEHAAESEVLDQSELIKPVRFSGEESSQTALALGSGSIYKEDQVDLNAIDTLLQAAEKALQQDFLMTPVGNNAFQFYSSILLLDPKNEAALQGIDAIQSRYLALAQKAISTDNTSLAELYLQRAMKVGASESDIKAVSGKTIQQVTTETDRHDREVVPEKNEHRKQQSHISFDKDRDLADRLRAEGLAQYETKALQTVQGSAPRDWTGVALADIYAANRNMFGLARLLETLQSSEQTSSKDTLTAYILAQTAIVEGDLLAAQKGLASQQFTFPLDQYRVRLLAAVYSSLNDFDQALLQYQRLIEMPQANSNDWLGYAVALERVGQPQAALRAYQKISQTRHIDNRINAYVKARITDLASAYYQ